MVFGTYRRNLSWHWHGMPKARFEVALTGRIADPTELMFVRASAQNSCAENPQEYWACGTLAERFSWERLRREGLSSRAREPR